ncbi:glycosyltransferase [Blastococcus brunescens]|uniref:Glycosyltransferase n=1 Tax=Blastococcus brunescens TaxID=1564165 RepID=A0ABZ1AV94_9ACTN|nr:glycosyltransferase [Blastococcus sp. BMG 8361]WRL61851.1 glycosyltransferase [Blastococcus sp. BMG 8361]
MVGTAHAHAQVVVEEIGRHAATGRPFDVVHTHLEVVGPAVLGALGDAAPPVLHTLHWDLRRNADFYESFDGRGRVFFAGVSDSQIERGPATLRRQALGSVPLSVPIPDSRPAAPEERTDSVLVLARLCEAKGIDIALRACRAAGVRLVLAGPVGGQPDRAALEAALADPTSPVRGYPDVRWFLEHVAPHLDGDRARWIGSVAGNEKADLLRRSRAVLFPIRWEEPGGTAVCEALAAGTPVVAMARGCLPRSSSPRSPDFWPRTRWTSPRRWAGWPSWTPRPAPRPPAAASAPRSWPAATSGSTPNSSPGRPRGRRDRRRAAMSADRNGRGSAPGTDR